MRAVEFTHCNGVVAQVSSDHTSTEVSKPQSSDQGWFECAASEHQIRPPGAGGDGRTGVSFKPGSASVIFMLGLTRGEGERRAALAGDTNYSSIDFAAYLDRGSFEVWEGNAFRGSHGAFAVGDTVEVKLNEEAKVVYCVNGQVRYTSGVQPQYPLHVKVCAFTRGPIASEVQWVGGPPEARADAKDQELKTLVSQDDAAMREVNAKSDSAIKELEAMSAKYESTSKELKAMSTKYDSAREELEAMSVKLEAMSAKYDSASKELERIAAAGQPANARGSALAAARAGHGAEERLAALEAVLDELQVDAGMLKDGASFRRWMAQQGFVKEQKFEARALKFGRSSEAAAGIEALIGMDEDDLHDKARGGLAAMRAEFEANGGPEDKANFTYVVEGVAQDKQWLPDHVKADIQKGQYHGGPLEPGDYDRNHSGMTLKDFVASLEAQLSKLKEHHVAALRLYTTSSYRKLNAPFRDRAPLPHPFAVTVFFLAQGLKKLRTVQAEIDPKGFAAESTLWRGLSNATIDLEAFKTEGGTELAPMSTSADRSVAAKYAASQSPLILRYKAKGLTRGVSLKFLSVYPKEEEFLYPPGTFLSFGGVEDIDGVTIVTVEPQMP